MKTLLATAALAMAFAFTTPAHANPAAAAFADYFLSSTATSAAGALGIGGEGGDGGKGGNSGPLTNQPATTQNDKTKVDSSVGVGLGQAPGAIVGCIGEQRYLWGAVQFPKTVPGGCVELLADAAIRSGDPTARTKGLEIMDRFAEEYFSTKPAAQAIQGDAAFRD